jgi:hypothetical protein
MDASAIHAFVVEARDRKVKNTQMSKSGAHIK